MQTLTKDPAGQTPSRQVTTRRHAHPFLLAVHLWLGLSLGAVLALIGISGSALIFRYELERTVFPALTHTSTTGTVRLDDCMAAAGALNPAKTVRSVRLPVNADGTLEWLTIPIGTTTKEDATTVYSDPHTCKVLGTRGPKWDVMSFIINLHHSLFLGKYGAYPQTLIAAAALALAISGFILWWPKSWTWSRVRPRASARPLHYAIGFWMTVPLMVVAFTATYMAWRTPINKALLADSAEKKPAAEKIKAADTSAKPKAPAHPISLDAVMAAARGAKPTATWRILTIPQKVKDPVSITYQLPSEYGRTGNNQIALKQAPDGTVRVVSETELHSGSRMKRFLTELTLMHYGEFAGITSRILWSIVGWMPAVLFCSGFLMWRRAIHAQQKLKTLTAKA